jgi:hypothetical protein
VPNLFSDVMSLNHNTGAASMYSRTDHYRRRAIHARQRAAQIIDPSLKADFEEAAENWTALAEQVEWAERSVATKESRGVSKEK